ncbi:DUF502 domain-containing protein [Salibacteraceae bacterium]|nr:DUF502 domain-containing protein [Salibacteraceae bacterium]MDB9708275.1 DUF502 domain-containing protein [Salibacteraceae bacterium]MDC1304679.1 DUF502 domain-containing protein [Salibacteraceae bacterium]
MKHFFSALLRYFVRGIIFLTPATVTVYVIVQIFIIIDGIIPIDIPGLGLLTLLGVIILFGILASTVLARPFVNWGNRLLKSAPMIKTIYSAIKDLVTAFVGTQKKFDRPVLVKMYEKAEVQKLGFLTGTDLEDLGIGKDRVAVYLPHSYAFSGNLFIVPAENVTPIDAKPADVMKFIVSGGVARMSDMEQELTD